MSLIFGNGLSDDILGDDDCLSDMYISTSNRSLRPVEGTTLAKIEQKQESGKNVIVIDTTAPLSKSTVEKVKKVISSTKQKPVGEEASKPAQIEEFMTKYKSFNEVPVKDMRHIIPLLLMEVYVEKYGHYTRKVKGLWEKRPEDWPASVPFVDPNNRLKNEGEKNVKPKKELLGQMLNYLVNRYTEMKKAVETGNGFLLHANDPLLSFANQSNAQNDNPSLYVLNLVETSDRELRKAEQSVSDLSLTTEHVSGYSSSSGFQLSYIPLLSVSKDDSLNQSSLSTAEDPSTGGASEEHGELVEDELDSNFSILWAEQIQAEVDARPPKQVVDNEEDQYCMNPLEEIRDRTKLKLAYLRRKVLVPRDLQDRLEGVHDLLMNLFGAELDNSAKLKLLVKWYKLDMCIDGMKFQQSCTYSGIIQDLHDELISEATQMVDLMSNTTLKSKTCTEAYDEQRMELSIPAEDPQKMNSLLNIRPRLGPAGGVLSFPPASQLEVRYLPSKQSESNNGCGVSSLSDNYKPIQPAQEDGPVQPPENPISSEEWNMLDDEELTELLLKLDQPQLSLPVQESAPATQATSQLAGKWEIPMEMLQSLMTNVSVQPWIGGNMTPVMSVPHTAFSSAAALPSQLISISSASPVSTAFAEEYIKRLSLSTNIDPFPPPLQNTNPSPPMQPLLDQLLCKPRAVGRSGGKRSYPFGEDDDMDETSTGPTQSAPAFSTVIPLVVEEMSNNLDKPFSRSAKKKTRQMP